MPSFRLEMLAPLTSLALVACSGGGDQPEVTDVGPFDRVVAATDVSILYPLTPATERAQLIAASARGAYGELLPELLLGDAPRIALDTDVGGTYADLRLVAVRLDPCSARDGCASEVRAIFQPVVVRDGGTLAADAAVHVFYAVPEPELVIFLKEILALKKAAGGTDDDGATLGVQPLLAATGLRGGFAVGLEAALLAHVGASRIQRVTSMSHLFLDGDVWDFALFERRGDRFEATPIVDVTSATQLVNGDDAHAPAIGGLFGDETPSLPGLSALAAAWRPEAVTAELAAGFAQAVAAQDPTRHTSEDTDCLSCHVAEGARRAGEELYQLAPTDAFTSARPLGYRRDGKALTNFHAFGYLGTQVSIMQRTSNETALVADWFQDALLAE